LTLQLLPDDVAVADLTFRLVETGFEQVGVGGSGEWIDRPGARFEVEASFPPLTADQARVLSIRLLRARREGMKLFLPAHHEYQGVPGLPVVDGGDSGGRVLKLRSATPGYLFKEGYWLTVVHAGQAAMHKVAAAATVDATGRVTLAVEPPLRRFPSDGDAVHVARAWFEGRPAAPEWQLTPDALRRGFAITLRESV